MTDTAYEHTRPQWQGMPDGPRVTLLGAARRHWGLILVQVLIAMAGAGAIGLAREPVYTASVRMNVGRLDVSAPGAVAGFSTATQALASAYSRAIHAEQVTGPVSRTVGLPRTAVDRQIAGTPLPNSSIFTIEGRGRTPGAAVLLANTTGRDLITYLTNLNRVNPDSQRLFEQFQAAALDVHKRSDISKRLEAALGSNPNSASRSAANQALATLDAAILRRETLRSVYQSSQGGQSSTSLVQILARATNARSDRGTRLQLLLFLGAAAGLVLGLVLATLRANRLMALANRA